MTSFQQWVRLLIKGLLRFAFRVYYRSIQVQGAESIPREGAVLLVANHPNSLLDPAILVHLIARPLHFGAKHTLFYGPLGTVLEAFGAIPLVRAQDDPRGGRRNLEALDRYAELLDQKLATAIFPEGISQDDPQVVPIKTGAARIALKAEAATDFNLGLRIVPVGLQFEPRRRFRADAFVRFGAPLKIADLAPLHAENPRQAIRELTGRIDSALKKLAFQVESQENLPLVERLVDVYLQRVRKTGLAGVDRKGLRGELLYRTADCLNHYAQADPDAVTEIARKLERYERLREKAGVDRRLLEEAARLLPGPLAPLQVAAEVLLGAIPALVGFLTGAIPYYLTRGLSNKILSKTKHPPTLSFFHILVGIIAFPLFYGLEIWLLSLYSSAAATIAFTLLLIPTGLFARFYIGRVWKLCSHLGGRVSSWMKLSAVTRVVQAQSDLLLRMDHMRDRYRVEVLGWSGLPPRRPLPLRTAFAVLLAVLLVLLGFFVAQLRDRGVEDLSQAPSLWYELRNQDPVLVTARLESDGRGTAAAIAELDRLEKGMGELRESFVQGAGSFYSQEDDDAIHQLLLTYLNLRTALLRTVWTYRAAHDDSMEGQMEGRAFLLAYASAATLLDKAAAIVDTFGDDEQTQRKLNEGDSAWEIPEGTYDRLLASLSSAEVVSQLQEAAQTFDRLQATGAYGSGSPWDELVEAALGAGPAIEQAADQIGARRLELALQEVRLSVRDPLYRAQALVSTWIGDFRLRDRPRHQGLIGPEQVEELRQLLQPGDIIIARRNWFLSNAFLPGFWPHAAFYLGDADTLEEMGVADDLRVTPHWDDFLRRDAAGHSHAVIEAMSEGVIFTSLEHAVGESDAVAVLRPRLTDSQRREAIARAFSHHGKPYDFEFDFFSTDLLVCSELVYRAYDGMLTLPLTTIMGRQTLPVNTFVQVFADGLEAGNSPFDLVQFLDLDMDTGRAFVASESEFVETLKRSGFTFLQP